MWKRSFQEGKYYRYILLSATFEVLSVVDNSFWFVLFRSNTLPLYKHIFSISLQLRCFRLDKNDNNKIYDN